VEVVVVEHITLPQVVPPAVLGVVLEELLSEVLVEVVMVVAEVLLFLQLLPSRILVQAVLVVNPPRMCMEVLELPVFSSLLFQHPVPQFLHHLERSVPTQEATSNFPQHQILF
jgi:hypothetical protein